MAPAPVGFVRVGEEMPFNDYTSVTTASTAVGLRGWSIDMTAEPIMWVWTDPAAKRIESKDKVKEAMRGYTAKKGKLYRR